MRYFRWKGLIGDLDSKTGCVTDFYFFRGQHFVAEPRVLLEELVVDRVHHFPRAVHVLRTAHPSLLFFREVPHHDLLLRKLHLGHDRLREEHRGRLHVGQAPEEVRQLDRVRDQPSPLLRSLGLLFFGLLYPLRRLDFLPFRVLPFRRLELFSVSQRLLPFLPLDGSFFLFSLGRPRFFAPSFGFFFSFSSFLPACSAERTASVWSSFSRLISMSIGDCSLTSLSPWALFAGASCGSFGPAAESSAAGFFRWLPLELKLIAPSLTIWFSCMFRVAKGSSSILAFLLRTEIFRYRV